MTWLRALPLLLLAAVLGVGCQTNTVELEFDSETTPGDSSGDAASTTGTMTTTSADTVSDTTGTPTGPQTLLLVLSTPLEPSLPFQAVVTLTPGTGTVDLTLQWLSLGLGSTTEPRQAVGDQYAYPGIPVDDAGFFYWDTGIILIPGAANPISGEDLVASVQMGANPFGTPAFCGEAGGTVVMPFEFPLAGSTHSMNLVADGVTFPVDFPLGCP